jgi:hypothetical protein
MPISGTSYYQPAIEAAAQGRNPSGPNVDVVTAELRLVREGEYSGAVHVYLGGAHVGSIPHDHASEFRPVVESLEADSETATCRAQIVGGHYEDDDEGWRKFGVWLLQPKSPRRFGSDDPFLPPLCGHTVDWAAEHEPLLNELLHSNAKTKRVAVGGEIVERRGQWLVRIADREIGPFDSNAQVNTKRLHDALAGGFPLTCQVRLIREPGKPLRVAADLP